MKTRFTGSLLLISLFLLTACGQKGPLYMEKSPAAQAAPAAFNDKANATESFDALVKPDSSDSSTSSDSSDDKLDR